MQGARTRLLWCSHVAFNCNTEMSPGSHAHQPIPFKKSRSSNVPFFTCIPGALLPHASGQSAGTVQVVTLGLRLDGVVQNLPNCKPIAQYSSLLRCGISISCSEHRNHFHTQRKHSSTSKASLTREREGGRTKLFSQAPQRGVMKSW